MNDIHDQKPDMSDADTGSEDQKPNFWQIVFSTLAAFLGVQSNKNRVRDFKYGNIYTYVVSGLIFTIIFIFCVVSVVKMVLSNAGI